MLKAPFVLETFKCLVIKKNGLIRKLWLISKLIMLQTREQIVIIHILLNVSKSKGHQAIKFGQLIKFCVRSISLYKS